jgi:hypothetical protein
VWPENWAAFELFARMDTQWRVSMAGPTGLDYTVALALMDLDDVPRGDRPAMLDDLRVMEAAAIQQMSKKQ